MSEIIKRIVTTAFRMYEKDFKVGEIITLTRISREAYTAEVTYGKKFRDVWMSQYTVDKYMKKEAP